MGAGTRRAQVEGRFGLGKAIDTYGTPCHRAKPIKRPKRLQIGEYDVKLGVDGYTLKKGDESLGKYREAKLLSPDRALFKLEKGMLLEVTPQSTRKILSPAKAGILGFINSDGSLQYSTEHRRYRVGFGSCSNELLDKFSELINEVYGISLNIYHHKKNIHFSELVKGSKEIAQDLDNYTSKAKTEGEWDVPFKYLDKDGSRMFLRCFMSGDGGIGIYQSSDHSRKLPLRVRFYSNNRKGLEEIAMLLRGHFGINSTIGIQSGDELALNVVTRADKIKYIKEIGSFKERHIRAIERALEVIKRIEGSEALVER